MSTFETAHIGLEEKLEAELGAIIKIDDVVERAEALAGLVVTCDGHLRVCDQDLSRMEMEGLQEEDNPTKRIAYEQSYETILVRRQYFVDILFKLRIEIQVLTSSGEYLARCSATSEELIAQISEKQADKSDAGEEGVEKPEGGDVEDQVCATCEKVGDVIIEGEEDISSSYKGLVKALPKPRRAGGENASGNGKKNDGNGMSA